MSTLDREHLHALACSNRVDMKEVEEENLLATFNDWKFGLDQLIKTMIADELKEITPIVKFTHQQ